MTNTQKNQVRREVKAKLEDLIRQAGEFVKKAKESKKHLKSGPVTISALSKIPGCEELGVSLVEFAGYLKQIEYDL